MGHNTTYTLVRDDDEIDIEVEYEVADYYPGRFGGPYGDREPPSGGEVETLDAFLGGKPFDLTAAEIEKIEQHIIATHNYGSEW